MSINYDSLQIGSVRAGQVTAAPGVAGTLLRFTLMWSLYPKREDTYAIFGTYVRVAVAAEGSSTLLFLGHGIPEVAWCNESREGLPVEQPLIYHLALHSDQILALEQLRGGRGLVFKVDVRGNGYGPYGIRQVYDSLEFRVPLSEWIQILRASQAADVLLVGVSLPLESIPGARTAIELVRHAHEFLLRGEYDAAVGECRRALESVWNAGKLEDAGREARKALSATMEERKSMSKRDRQLALGEAVINFSHPAHHVAPGGVPEIFSNLDAAIAVACTAALVSSFAHALTSVEASALPEKGAIDTGATASGPSTKQ